MVINFFVPNGNNSNINKLSSMIGFTNNKIEEVNKIINISVLLLFAAGLFVMIFIFKIAWVMITSKTENIKINIIESSKEFGKSLIVLLCFMIIFTALFTLFDLTIRQIDKSFKKLDQSHSNKLNNIPSYIYEMITNGQKPTKDGNFLFPSNWKTGQEGSIDSLNFLVSILFVNAFAFFLIWIIWSIFQKMIEIFILYLTFPIATAVNSEKNKINWKIWIKEIINKIILVIIMLILLRVFIYMFYFIYTNSINNNKLWHKYNEKLYISFLLILALGFSLIFTTKLFANKEKEHIGIFTTFISFKQMQRFIQNNSQNINNNKNNVFVEPINQNINNLRNEINYLNKMKTNDFSSLKKVKVFKH